MIVNIIDWVLCMRFMMFLLIKVKKINELLTKFYRMIILLVVFSLNFMNK